MFQIKCPVDDKKLAMALKALDGLVFHPEVIPVRNAAVENGDVVSTRPEGSASDLLQIYLNERPSMKQVRACDLSSHLMENGFAKGGYSYATKKLVESGSLKKTKVSGVYDIIRKGNK